MRDQKSTIFFKEEIKRLKEEKNILEEKVDNLSGELVTCKRLLEEMKRYQKMYEDEDD